jgi:HK97 family phage portal protein
MATWRQALGSLIAGRPATERKESSTMAAIVASGSISARWNFGSYAANAREGYAKNPYVYAAIDRVATTIAGIAWNVYSDPEKTKKLTEHPLLTLLNRPNPREGKSFFFQKFMGYLLLDGNVFVQRVGPDKGPPKELYALRPDRVDVIVGNPQNPIAGYVYTIANVKVPMPEPLVRHFKTFHPLDDWRGLSPMSAAAMSTDQSNASKAWNVSLLQNGAQPPGAMSTSFNLDDDAYIRLKDMIQEEYSGFMNAGRPLLLEGGVTWQQMGMTAVEMAWIEGQKLSAREIAIVYNVAPELIGDSANKTYSNYGEARVALYQENALPRCDYIRDELNAWLSPLYDDTPYIDYEKDDIEALQEDHDAVWQRADNAFTDGLVKLGVAQKMVGEEVDPKWGDKYIWELPARVPAPAQPGADGLDPNAPPVDATVSEVPADGNGSPRQIAPPKDGSGSSKDNPDNIDPSAPKPATAPTTSGAPAPAKAGEGATKRILPFDRAFARGGIRERDQERDRRIRQWGT